MRADEHTGHAINTKAHHGSFGLFYQGPQMLYEDHHQLCGAERQVAGVTADIPKLLTKITALD